MDSPDSGTFKLRPSGLVQGLEQPADVLWQVDQFRLAIGSAGRRSEPLEPFGGFPSGWGGCGTLHPDFRHRDDMNRNGVSLGAVECFCKAVNVRRSLAV